MGALYGKALAKTIPGSTTGNQALAMFAALRAAIASANGVLANYGASDTTTAAVSSGLDALPFVGGVAGSLFGGLAETAGGPRAAAQAYLSDTAATLDKYQPNFVANDTQIAAAQLVQLRVCVSTTSVAVKYVDDNFSTGFLAELADSLLDAADTVGAAVAKTVSHVVGSFFGATWWIWVVAGVAIVVYYSALAKGRRLLA